MSNTQIVITERDHARLSELLMGLDQAKADIRDVSAELTRRLDRAKKVTPSEVPPHVVTMNSRVRVTDMDSGDSLEYTIAWPGEADTREMKVSVFAPIGVALLGASVGGHVQFRAPAGLRSLRIDKILFQPEAAGVEENVWSVARAAPPPSPSSTGFHT